MIRATVWNEFAFSCKSPEALAVYPKGHHEVIKDFLNATRDIKAKAVTLDMPEQGLPDKLLKETDVLLWWGHCLHDDVSDALADKIVRRVYEGMGLILLHSAHLSKPFKRVLGASGRLDWGEGGERERLWVTNPAHPIAKDLPAYIDLPLEEMYGEPFGIPEPDNTVFTCWYQGGRVFRGGITYNRGAGKVFSRNVINYRRPQKFWIAPSWRFTSDPLQGRSTDGRDMIPDFDAVREGGRSRPSTPC